MVFLLPSIHHACILFLCWTKSTIFISLIWKDFMDHYWSRMILYFFCRQDSHWRKRTRPKPQVTHLCVLHTSTAPVTGSGTVVTGKLLNALNPQVSIQQLTLVALRPCCSVLSQPLVEQWALWSSLTHVEPVFSPQISSIWSMYFVIYQAQIFWFVVQKGSQIH